MAGYRDELRALRVRKEALEAEVEELRETEDELEEARAALGAREQQIRELQGQLAALSERAEEEDAGDEPLGEAPARRKSVLPLIAFLGVAAMGIGARLVWGVDSAPVDAAPSPPAMPAMPAMPAVPQPPGEGLPLCVISSTPQGAWVTGDATAYVLNGGDASGVIRREEPLRLGRTPMSVVVSTYTLTLRKDGYAPTKVTLTADDLVNDDCRRSVQLNSL